jgi:diguanylate cyclase (GGDEF)-like protein
MRREGGRWFQVASAGWGKHMKKIFFLIAFSWTILIVIQGGWSYRQAYNTAFGIALAGAGDTFNRDLVYRRWAAVHGGVYVPVTPAMPPNPYLESIPERDIEMPSGKKLTMVNPAYMTRQVHELGKEEYGLRGHITSLKPIRPENAPDEWERNALLAFSRGEKEVSSLETLGKETYFRLMRPLIAEQACLKCHALQGYKAGDIRGGISISVPWAPFHEGLRSQMRTNILTYGSIWVIGLIGLWFGWNQINRYLSERNRIEEEIHTLSITDPLTGLKNRRGFLSLAEQQLKLSDRNKSGLALFFADLDGLKRINDMFGHEEGDKAIVEAANVLKETFRASDIIARLGGDEFAVLAIDTDEADSEIFKYRMQQLIDIRNKQGNRKYRLSISVGCSYYDPENPFSIDELIARADKLMYEQKQEKREA